MKNPFDKKREEKSQKAKPQGEGAERRLTGPLIHVDPSGTADNPQAPQQGAQEDFSPAKNMKKFSLEPEGIIKIPSSLYKKKEKQQ